jgi:hypothetical protein
MKYDDFSLPQNWENLARAYSENLKNKGFVFVKIDNEQNKKFDFVKTCHELLEKVLHLYKQIGKKVKAAQGEQINKLLYLTENSIKQLEGFYPNVFNLQNSNTHNSFNMFNFLPLLISLEAKIIRNTLLLLEQEDDMEKHIVIKTNLLSRLELLENIN